MNEGNELRGELVALLFELGHPIPAHFDKTCPHVAERLREAVKTATDKVRQGYCPIKADRELKEELRDFVKANVGACSQQVETLMA